MANNNNSKAEGTQVTSEEQTPALKQLLSVLNTARKLISMYGEGHPNSQAAVANMTASLEEFVGCYERATCVFTPDSVIINHFYYQSSTESRDLCERLRARGVMAITFVDTVTADQVIIFLEFLHEEPRVIREEGGASNYLRNRGITRIVVTESIYSSGQESEDTERSQWDGQSEDMIIAAVIEWLIKQDEPDTQNTPKFPITKLLSHPDSAAKLIREAVTKLHASRRNFSEGECINEAINSLKAAIGDNKEEWDKAVPQVRKAIAKLPQDMRPSMTGFSVDGKSSENYVTQPTADIEEAENMVHGILEKSANCPQPENITPPQVFDSFFGAKPVGLLSIWKNELQPSSVLSSSGKTLEVLMNWEANACEHGRIANALAILLQRAVEVDDTESALSFTEGLLNVALQDTELGWRRTNVLGALNNLDNACLSKMIKSLAFSKRSRAEETIDALLELIPGVALNLTNLLGARGAEGVAEPLEKAFVRLGQAAQPTLSKLLQTGAASAKEITLKILVCSGREWAAKEIENLIKQDDTAFTTMALYVLPRMKMPKATQICMDLMSHPEQHIRCAALQALGELGDRTAVPLIAKIAVHRRIISDHSVEQMAAIEALGKIGGSRAMDTLKAITKSRPLIGRSKFEAARNAAQKYIDEAQSLDLPDYIMAA